MLRLLVCDGHRHANIDGFILMLVEAAVASAKRRISISLSKLPHTVFVRRVGYGNLSWTKFAGRGREPIANAISAHSNPRYFWLRVTCANTRKLPIYCKWLFPSWDFKISTLEVEESVCKGRISKFQFFIRSTCPLATNRSFFGRIGIVIEEIRPLGSPNSWIMKV